MLQYIPCPYLHLPSASYYMHIILLYAWWFIISFWLRLFVVSVNCTVITYIGHKGQNKSLVPTTVDAMASSI